MSHRSRRTHLVLLLVAISLIYIIFFSSESFSSSSPSFRARTESAIARSRHSPLRGDLSDEDLLAVTNAKLSRIIGKTSNSDAERDGVVVLKGTRTPPATPDTTKEAGGGGRGRGKKDVDTEVNDDDTEEVAIAGRISMPKAKDGSGSGSGSGSPPSPRKQAQQQQWEQQRQQQQALRDKNKPKYPKTNSDGSSSDSEDDDPLTAAVAAASSDPGEIAARQELQSILKKAPIIIFSKSYCPYSRRAKQVLLHDYDIVPKPYVVELDQLTDPLPTIADDEEEEAVYDDDEDDDDDDEDDEEEDNTKESNNKKSKSKPKPKSKPKSKGKDTTTTTTTTTSTSTPPVTMGRKIQDLLKSLTGRSTVPNIMIASQSLGGSDEIVDLHNQGNLADQIRKLAGKRIVSVEPVTGDDGDGDGDSSDDDKTRKKNKKDTKETRKKRTE